MKPSDTAKLVVAAVALAVGGFLIYRQLTAPKVIEGDPEMTYWLCTNKDCGAPFTVPSRDLARLRQGNLDATPQCPRCAKATTVLAVPCPNCGKYLRPVGHGQLPEVCPECGKPARGASELPPGSK